MDNLTVDVNAANPIFRTQFQGLQPEAAIKTSDSNSPNSQTEMMISSPHPPINYSTSTEMKNGLSKSNSNHSISNMLKMQANSSSVSTPIKTEYVETSAPPYHPAIFQQQVISNNPDKFHSHFIKLRSPNRKGQTRYRCVTCSHEFECTGKLRLIQHILGAAYTGNQSKNVRSCPLPYQPLKDALLQIHGQVNGIASVKSESTSEPGTPKPTSTPSRNPPPSLDIRQPISFDSFYTNKSASMDDSTTAEDCSRSDNEICEFLTGIGATEDDFLNADLGDDSIMKIEDIEEMLNPSTTSQASKRLKTGDTSEFLLNQINPPKNRMYTIANKAVIQFFSNYRLPVTAVEDPLFLELLSAIRVAGPYYRPNMVSLLQDTQVIGGNNGANTNASVSSASSVNSSSMGAPQPPSQQSQSRQQLHQGSLFSMSAPDLRSAFNNLNMQMSFSNNSLNQINSLNLGLGDNKTGNSAMNPPQQIGTKMGNNQPTTRTSPPSQGSTSLSLQQPQSIAQTPQNQQQQQQSQLQQQLQQLQQHLQQQSHQQSTSNNNSTTNNQFQHLNQHLGQLRQTHSMPSMPRFNGV